MSKTHYLILSFILAISFVFAACTTEEVADDGDDADDVVDESNDNAEFTNNSDGESDNSDGGHAGEVEPQHGGNLIIGLTAEPTIINTLYALDGESFMVEKVVQEPLIREDLELEFESTIAEDWEFSDDETTYTFFLKEGIKFHDGEEFTADDVAFTYNLVIHEDYAGPRGGRFEVLEEVKVIDDYTVEFHLAHEDAAFLSYLTYGIQPSHVFNDVPIEEVGEHEINFTPIGTGPFQFEEWVDGEYLRFTAFDDYHGEGPFMESVTFDIVPDSNALLARLESGEVDYMSVEASDIQTAYALEEAGHIDIHSTLGLEYNYLGYNLELDMFQDKETRQALTHAINRQLVVDELLYGEGEVVHGGVSPLSWAHPDEEDLPIFDYDPDRSKELLAEAGWTEGEDGILERDGEPFSFTLLTTSGSALLEDLAVIIQSELSEVGIEVNPEILEGAAFQDVVNNFEHEAIVSGWALSPDPDPSLVFHSSEIERGSNNTGYSNSELDEAMEGNRNIINEEERAELLQDIFAQISEDQPYTFLYASNDIWVTTPNIKGYEQHPRESIYDINKWWFE